MVVLSIMRCDLATGLAGQKGWLGLGLEARGEAEPGLAPKCPLSRADGKLWSTAAAGGSSCKSNLLGSWDGRGVQTSDLTAQHDGTAQ